LPKGTKIGHTGTLDPLASGLLVLLLGRATRLSRYVTGLDKSYVATASFGAVSDTLDAEGRITPLQNATTPDEDAIRVALRHFTGELLQTPPMASAVKVGGERLYKAQRRGETVGRGSRPVTVYNFELLTLDTATATFHVSCSSGTYVRSLISDLATYLSTGAYLSALRRTSVGHMTVQNAPAPEDLALDTLKKRIIQPKEVVAHLPGVEVGLEERASVCNGHPLGAFGSSGSFRVELGGELLAIFRDEGERARAEVVLCDP
jgi:tRNA pseudouridine55 synthase